MPPGKPKRDREWTADALGKDAPKLDLLMPAPGGGGPQAPPNNDQLRLFLAWLYQWARDMSAWGQDMRDDLIRLEGQAGFPSGDPGDPPGGPPE